MREIEPVRDDRPGAAGVLGGNGAAALAGIAARDDDARNINRPAGLRYRKPEAFVTYGSVLVLHDRLSTQSMHRHRAIELVVALEGRFDIATEGGRIAGCEARVVFPNEGHALLGSDGRVARLYVDPGLRRMPPPCARRHVPPPCRVPDLARSLSLVREGRPKLDTTKALIGRWQAEWLPWLATAETYDPRIATALGIIDAHMAPSATRASLAALVNLSPGRFAALFVRDTAMSLRLYLRWRRVLTAARLIREGKSITYAAIAAGFADSAHLTRTYRATFGAAPSSLQGILVAQPTSARHREPRLA